MSLLILRGDTEDVAEVLILRSAGQRVHERTDQRPLSALLATAATGHAFRGDVVVGQTGIQSLSSDLTILPHPREEVEAVLVFEGEEETFEVSVSGFLDKPSRLHGSGLLAREFISRYRFLRGFRELVGIAAVLARGVLLVVGGRDVHGH